MDKLILFNVRLFLKALIQWQWYVCPDHQTYIMNCSAIFQSFKIRRQAK